jgi:hypothetical protein
MCAAPELWKSFGHDPQTHKPQSEIGATGKTAGAAVA